jgi:hypothetical protein
MLFVVVLISVMTTLLPQQASTAEGGRKDQGLPHWTVWLLAQTITGGAVSRLVTI